MCRAVCISPPTAVASALKVREAGTMARVRLTNLRHSYRAQPQTDADWAVKRIDVEWANGSANALLGPSGCGKTTLLNIISGLLRPTEGAVHFDQQDVTALPPDARNIAQV